MLPVFDVAAADQGFQGCAEFVVAYLNVGGSKVLAQLVLAHLCPMCFEELAYLCHLVLPGGNVNGSAGDGDLDRAVLVADQVCHSELFGVLADGADESWPIFSYFQVQASVKAPAEWGCHVDRDRDAVDVCSLCLCSDGVVSSGVLALCDVVNGQDGGVLHSHGAKDELREGGCVFVLLQI